MSVCDFQTQCKLVDSGLVEQTVLDQTCGEVCQPRARVDAGVPRGQFRAATQAWAVTRRLRGRSAGEEAAVLLPWGTDRADRTTIYSSGRDAHEEATVE